MENQFKLGTNFDPKVIEVCKKLNDQYAGKARVMELFSSTREMADSSGRPDFRLANLSKEETANYIKACNDAGIKFNWTCNSIIPYGSKVNMYNHKKEFQDQVKWLEDIGVYRITVANPMLLEFIREVSDIELELSTIMHVDTVTQIKYFHDTYKVNKVCGSILKNRDFKFLKNAAKYCNDNGIIYEVLAQEFCGVAGSNPKTGTPYATHCPFRDSCYICHSTNKTKEDAELYNTYPMNRCMSARYTTPEAWLRMRWVRPQDLHYYNDVGINYFKITGRTGSTEYIEEMINAYMSGVYNKNLLSLWKPLETIYNNKKESDYKAPVYIPCDKLDGFLDHWVDNPDFDCSDVECGVQCNWCKRFMEKIEKETAEETKALHAAVS